MDRSADHSWRALPFPEGSTVNEVDEAHAELAYWDAMTESPIFVIGCGRSGTTLVRLMLDAHPHISCGPETGFLADLAPVVGKHWPRYRRFGLPRERWLRAFAEMFDGIQREYAESRGKPRWADKTPRHVRVADFLAELYPSAQFVHVIRDGRDVVASHRRRWGYRRGLIATIRWHRDVTAGRRFGTAAGPRRYLEVRYEDLVSNPEREMRRVVDFLQEPWAPEMLSFLDLPHDVSDSYAQQHLQRRTELGESGAVYRGRVGAGASELDLLQRLLLLPSGRLLRKLGYIERRCRRRRRDDDN